MRLVSGDGHFAFNYWDGSADSFQEAVLATSEWQRFSWTFTGNGSAGSNVAVLHDYGQSTAGVYEIWGAQLNAGADAQVYLPTAGVPVITTDPGQTEVVSESTITITIHGQDEAQFQVGGAQPDTLLGTGGDDTLRGNGGADSLDGKAGNDSLEGGSGADLLQGNAGDDSMSGGSDADTLEGGPGNDTLDGGTGANLLDGGDGNDTYLLRSADETVIETAGAPGGIDLVQAAFTYTLPTDVENLKLVGTAAADGTGNGSDNVITGNTKDNHLSGLDGADSLSGGNGADTLDGGEGADTLDGGGGVDLLQGGNGDDLYVLRQVGDTVVEFDGTAGGIDTVMSAVNYTLTANVERLELIGTAAINGKGNADANEIIGNAKANQILGLGGEDTLRGGSGNDTLLGGQGADLLEGGAGEDVFRYAAPSNGGDTILDYAGRWDTLEVSAAGFGGGLVAGMDLLATGHYAQNQAGVANAAAAQFVFNTVTKALYFDADGTGAGAAVLIAEMPGVTGWNAAEIVVIA